MFDDQQNQGAGSVPGNLPAEPVDIFADVDEAKDNSVVLNQPSPTTSPPPSPSPLPVRPRSIPVAPPSGGALSGSPVASASPGAPAPQAGGALSAGMLQPKAQTGEAPVQGGAPVGMAATEREKISTLNQGVNYPVSEPKLGKFLTFIFVLIMIVCLGLAIWWAYGKFTKSEETVPATTEEEAAKSESEVSQEPSVTPSATEETSTVDVANEIKNESILFGEPIDSDDDGLDDSREKTLGTNHLNPDSDEDGLTDGDEVIIWKTNPLNRDSDEDGYEDGEEVSHGYNPLGPGKLFNLPSSSTTTTTVATTTVTTGTEL